MENIFYLIIGIIIGDLIGLKWVITIVSLFCLITNTPSFDGHGPRGWLILTIQRIFLFIMGTFNKEKRKIEMIEDNKNNFEEIEEIKQIKFNFVQIPVLPNHIQS